ncbi:OsmC family protein [soil metagenome]
MADVKRKGRVEWEGGLAAGNGSLSLKSSDALRDSPVTWASRVERPDGRTSPEELVAAAHAACYAMALSLTLSEKGNEPDKLAVDATCTFDDEQVKVTTVDLEIEGTVTGLDAEEFREVAEEAEQICPVSNALRGNVEIRLNTRLS